jgi:hypothetical protein
MKKAVAVTTLLIALLAVGDAAKVDLVMLQDSRYAVEQ